MELPTVRGGGSPTRGSSTYYHSSTSPPQRRSSPVNSILFLFFSLVGLFTLVLRRLLVLGDPTNMLDQLANRELWVPWSSYLLPHRKRQSTDETTALALAENLDALLVIGVITGSNHENRIRAAQKTWLTSMDPEMDAVVFFSDNGDPLVPTVGIADTGASWVGAQSRWLPALSYLHGTYTKAEWFMIADDDTFVVPGGLKRMLGRYDSNKQLYLGRVMFTPPRSQEEGSDAPPPPAATMPTTTTTKDELLVPFAHGGSGAVLSRGLMTSLEPHLSSCESFSGYGDGDLGYCIRRKLGVDVTHQACMHSSTPEAFEGQQDLFMPVADLTHPCTFHYAFRAGGDDSVEKNSASVNHMVEWQARFNSKDTLGPAEEWTTEEEIRKN